MGSNVNRSLGPLNFLHIWHDNTGEGADASWFLKSFVVHDLQTMERSDFICQRWLAVEKDDGLVGIPSVQSVRLDYFSHLDRTRLTSRGSFGKECSLTRVIQTDSIQCLRWSSLVFNLFPTRLLRVHTCATVYLLFRSLRDLHVSEHHLLRCRFRSKS
jgi:hypothetical protein